MSMWAGIFAHFASLAVWIILCISELLYTRAIARVGNEACLLSHSRFPTVFGD